MLRRDPESVQRKAGPNGRWSALAVVIFAACLLHSFLGIWAQGFATFVPSVERAGAFRATTEADIRLAVWGTSRNAWVLTRAPWRFFEAEPCYPTPRSLTLGHPMLSLGALGAPVRPFAPDPVATYNAVLALVFLSSAFAMYLLVLEWTGTPAAGIAAGVLFAFHPVALDRVIHLQIYDLSWTLWAFLFATRLCQRGRWPDALGLGAALVLQMGGSFYAAAICALVGAPYFAWLLWRHRGVRPAQGAAVLAIALLGATLIYGPYLAARETEEFERSAKFFLAWSAFLPGGLRDPGLLVWVLVACGLLAWRARAFPSAGGDPRPALLLGGLLAALAATGGVAGSPFFYSAIRWIPGFATVRVPSVLAAGTHLALCALAGLGVAVLIRAVRPRFAALAAGALVTASLVAALQPAALGLERGVPLYAFHARPAQDEIEFFGALAAAGDAGPILELPVLEGHLEASAHSVLLSAYHHRQVSTCYNSIRPRARADIASLAAGLPDRDAQRLAREMGFTTILIRHPAENRLAQVLRARFEQAQNEVPVPLLRPLLATPERSAFALAAP